MSLSVSASEALDQTIARHAANRGRRGRSRIVAPAAAPSAASSHATAATCIPKQKSSTKTKGSFSCRPDSRTTSTTDAQTASPPHTATILSAVLTPSSPHDVNRMHQSHKLTNRKRDRVHHAGVHE